MILKLTLIGEPQAKQSFRYAIRENKDKTKKFVSKYQPKKVVDNARNIAWEIKSQLPKGFIPFDCPLSVTALFVFYPPKSWSKKLMADLAFGVTIYKDTKPDLDNLFKAIGDAMGGVVYINDSRICKKSVEKIYGMRPRIELTIEPANIRNPLKVTTVESLLPFPVSDDQFTKENNNANHFEKDKIE